MAAKDTTPARRTTIYDLAALAGTSASAVSAVLNGSWKKRRISQKLADRIMRIAEEQGYSVNIQASLLRRERSNIIGMIVPKYDNRYFGAIAEQFEARARRLGLFPVITCTQRDPDLELEAARELVAYRIDCLVSTGATDPDHISALCAAAGVRTINLDLPGSKAPSIISDNYSGALDLTRHILDRCEKDLGDKRPLLFVGGRATDHNTGARIRGFRDAHAERGIPVSEEFILACGYAAEKAERALAALDMPLPRGMFVNSTITLEGVVRWLNQNRPPSKHPLRYGCFDWDPFAVLLPGNIGMVQQDVTHLLDKVFEELETPSGAGEPILVPCILRTL
ncbi:LacI family DNA-binding transcriptional regulator [Devosia nitrariae]|uniref:LacI family transcriptional regulator n=1 Tax=Devosia nitrariae TaxID=2071872 RepID=A0ABQ5WBR8_9HYPH|nr:LacI family DNA-binding transcriptional regulator [Devosia nitrariae]GLQ57046.1 LacI family transcriptional regulator [Devosia nitrariae]